MQTRVKILKEKQKSLVEEQAKSKKRNPSIDYQRIKKELERKYKEYENWQKKCYNSLNKNALNMQIREHVNQCVVIENEIKEQRVLLEDERKAFKKLQKSIKGKGAQLPYGGWAPFCFYYSERKEKPNEESRMHHQTIQARRRQISPV